MLSVQSFAYGCVPCVDTHRDFVPLTKRQLLPSFNSFPQLRSKTPSASRRPVWWIALSCNCFCVWMTSKFYFQCTNVHQRVREAHRTFFFTWLIQRESVAGKCEQLKVGESPYHVKGPGTWVQLCLTLFLFTRGSCDTNLFYNPSHCALRCNKKRACQVVRRDTCPKIVKSFWHEGIVLKWKLLHLFQKWSVTNEEQVSILLFFLVFFFFVEIWLLYHFLLCLDWCFVPVGAVGYLFSGFQR